MTRIAPIAPFLIAPALILAMLCAPALAAVPRLVPDRDVVVDYAVHPRDHADLDVQVSIEAGGAHLRITSPDLPTAFLVDRPARLATILLPMLKLYATVGIGREDPEETVLRRARFERHGRGVVAGHACTEWTAVSPDGTASACLTEDGVILRGTASDAHGTLGSVLASTVQYGALSPALFRRPEDFRNAGTLPVDGFGR